MIKLDKSISIIVPKFKNDGSYMSQKVFNRLDDLTKLLGGVTIHKADGHWFNDEGKKHVDSNLIYEWNVGDVGDIDVTRDRIMLCILTLLNAGEQEAVLFKLGTTAYIYDKSTKNIDSEEAELAIENYFKGDKNNG